MNSAIRFMKPQYVLFGILAFFPVFSHAVQYDTQKNFMKRNVPEGSKLTKKTFILSESKKKELAKEWKWDGELKELSMIIAWDEKGNSLGTVYLTTLLATEHECVHKIGVALDADGSVKEVIIFELTCERAMPAASKSFLGQFFKKKMKPLVIDEDINGITNVTESAKAVIKAVNTAMSGYSEFVLKQTRMVNK